MITNDMISHANGNQNFSDQLLAQMLAKARSGDTRWYKYEDQRVLLIDIAIKLAVAHAHRMTPRQVVDYAIDLNDEMFNEIVRGNIRSPL